MINQLLHNKGTATLTAQSLASCDMQSYRNYTTRLVTLAAHVQRSHDVRDALTQMKEIRQ